MFEPELCNRFENRGEIDGGSFDAKTAANGNSIGKDFADKNVPNLLTNSEPYCKIRVERSCLIVKPDGVCKNICGQIFATLQNNNLKLIALKMLKPSKEVIEQFYSIHIGKPFFEKLISFMLKAPIIVSVWEGENAVAKIRQLIGATNSADAAPGTLRAKYGTDNRRNVVHASDSTASADIEIKHFFADHEIFHYSQDAWKED